MNRPVTRLGPRSVIFGYMAACFIWLAVSTPFVWKLRQSLLWVVIFRALYFAISTAILYLMLKRGFALRERLDEYEQLLQTILEPVIIHENGTILAANLPAVQFFGAVTVDNLMGKSLMDFVHSDYRTVAQKRIRQLVKGQSTNLLEEKFLTLTGDVRDIEITGIPVNYHRKSAILINFRDITERKKSEDALRDSENRLRTLIDAIPDQICFIDHEERLTEANSTLLRSVGLEGNDYRGKTAVELAELCDPKLRESFVNHSHYDAITWEHGTYFTHTQGTPTEPFAAHEITQVPIKKSDGSTMGLVVISRNVTAERLAMKKLMESEQRYRSLFDNEGDMVVSVDVGGMICVANSSCEFTLGYSPNELIGRYYSELIAPEYRDDAGVRFHRIMQGEPQSLFSSLVHQSGDQLDVYEKSIPIVIGGKVTGFFWIIRDITNQKLAEELLIQSERLTAIGQMAAGIAHEIRNPLTALKGFVQLMLPSRQTEKSYLMVMKGELERIELIVDELLNFSKPSLPLMERYNCTHLLIEVNDLMFAHANMKNIVISQSTHSANIEITCDKTRFKQVLVNVLKNAIEAMPNGGTIDTGVRVIDEQSISIYVRDNGPGIPEDVLTHLGEPFYTTKNTGTGLGLMVSQKIIDAHDGTLRIHSQIGQGTEIEIVLPAIVKYPVEPQKAVEQPDSQPP